MFYPFALFCLIFIDSWIPSRSLVSLLALFYLLRFPVPFLFFFPPSAQIGFSENRPTNLLEIVLLCFFLLFARHPFHREGLGPLVDGLA